MKCNPWRWAWGLIPLVLIGFIALLAERERIEADLTNRSMQELQRAGLSWAKVSFQGRDGTITGLASDEAEPGTASGLVRELRGVRIVSNSAQLVEKVDAYTWQAALAKGKLRLSGHVPNEETRRTILGVAKAKFPGRDVEDRMTIARGAPARDTWLGGINFGLNQLASLKSGVVDIETTNLSVAGEAEDTGSYRAVKSALSRNLPQGLRLKRENVTPPVVSPYVWGAKWAGKKVQLSGFVPSEAQRQKLVADAKKAFPGAAVDDRMELGAGAPDGWAAATGAAIAELAGLEEGSADLKANQLSVTGLAGDEGRAERARRGLRSGLPSGIRLADQIRFREPPKPDPAELEAKRRADAEAAARKAADEAASKKAAEEAEAKRRADAEAAARKAAADAEAKRRADADAAARKTAAEAEEAAAKRRAELQRCQDALNVAKAGIIRFQRASAEIEAASFSTLDKVAKAAQACPNARIEIEGHTDAEGTPERNQRLSDRRAQSIVTYLTNAGVEAGKLTAIGYGQDRPVAPNDTPENRAKNRRIEFTVKAN
jgi:outer membrane protein OmpA-like peptidoglycan-associated protein/osmotically-inducible protein OsmY